MVLIAVWVLSGQQRLTRLPNQSQLIVAQAKVPPPARRPLMSLFDTARFFAWGLCQCRKKSASPRRIQAVQERRLRRLLRYAAERSPFYREKYRRIDLARCCLADLPVTTKT